MILAIIVIAVVIVLGSKLLKGIFNTIGHAIKIIVKVAFYAALALIVVATFCKQNHDEAVAVATVAQSPKLAKEAAKALSVPIGNALKAESEALTGKDFEETKKDIEGIKDVIKEGKANAKACEEELYGESDIVIE